MRPGRRDRPGFTVELPAGGSREVSLPCGARPVGRGLSLLLPVLGLLLLPGCRPAAVSSAQFPDAEIARPEAPPPERADRRTKQPQAAADSPAGSGRQTGAVRQPPAVDPRVPEGGDGPPPGASSESDYPVVGHRFVDELPKSLVVFETVFWDARDSTYLRDLIRSEPLVRDKTVLEIGTGTGLIALCCLQAGARRVVATDINPAAVANAARNARRLGFAERFETRLVARENADAFAAISPSERFDRIVSNPPWESAVPKSIDEYALYDDRFALLRSLLEGLAEHLAPGGKAYLVYGHAAAIRAAERLAGQFRLRTRRLDDRDLDQLPRIFLPGMVLEVVPQEAKLQPKS